MEPNWRNLRWWIPLVLQAGALAIYGAVKVIQAGKGSASQPVTLVVLIIGTFLFLASRSDLVRETDDTGSNEAAGLVLGALMFLGGIVGAWQAHHFGAVALAIGVAGVFALVLWATSADRGALSQPTGASGLRASRRVPAAVVRSYTGAACGACGRPFEVGSPVVCCPDCRQWYHLDCWGRRGGCVTEGCPSARPMHAAPVASYHRQVPTKAAAMSGGRYARPAAPAPPGVPARPIAVARAVASVGICPYCQTAIAAGSDYLTCPACKTPYHPDCWQENGGCAVRGCAVRAMD